MTERLRATLAIALALAVLQLGSPLGALGQEATPVANESITLTAEPLLGGFVRPGSWVGVRVTVQNDGPAVSGELRLSSATQGGSTYGVLVELAPGAHQVHYLYAPISIGNRLTVSLVSGSTEHARVAARLTSIGSGARGVFVIAERPEGLVGGIRAGLGDAGSAQFASLAPEDLPSHAAAWTSMDLLVWHDVEAGRLDTTRLDSLRTWVVMGGDLVILCGSTGIAGVSGFPADLLPFQPTQLIDIPAAELTAMLGNVPAGLGARPALAGRFERGTLLGGSTEAAIAGRTAYGMGTVTLIGLNPAEEWLSEGPPAEALWRLALPSGSAVPDARLPANDEFLVQELGNLPAVQLPRTGHLMLLILGYIVAIGPLNYIILKRRDRREWAWLTMPLTMAGFALAAFGIGAALRGSEVVVNELVVVQGSVGADAGLADVHVGVFSPGSASFDLTVSGGALISAPTASAMFEGPGQPRQRPLDVLLGDPSRLRDYGVGFGALRAFRAHAMVAVPRVEADVRLDGQRVTGTVVNASQMVLSDVAVVYAGGVELLGDLAPGESRSVSVRPFPEAKWEDPLAWRLYPFDDFEDARTDAARRSLVQHLTGGWEPFQASGVLSPGPVVLAWVPGGVLDVDVGRPAEHVGQTLYLLPAQVAIAGPVAFSGASLEQVGYESDALEGFYDPSGQYFLSRGTLTADYRPVGFRGKFTVSQLSIRLGFEGASEPAQGGDDLLPLPSDEQPDSDAPLASTPRADEGPRDLPRLQMFDHVAGKWVEFEPPARGKSYVIVEPARYVDDRGGFRVRFVLRSDEFAAFGFSVRLEGEVE